MAAAGLAQYAVLWVMCLSGASALRKNRAMQQEGDCYSPYDGKPLLRFKSSSAAERMEILDNLTSWGCTDLSEDVLDEFEVICGLDAATALMEHRGESKLVEKDAGAFYRGISGVAKAFREPAGPSTKDAFFADWRDTDSRLARVEAAVSASQGVATYEQIGTSIENEAIMAVRIRGSGWSSGMPRVVAVFQAHAREWICGMTGVFTVENVIQRAIDDPTWLAGMELVMVPAANPDGIRWSETSERMFRKNRRVNAGSSCKGVDLNRQYPPGWGGPHSTSTNPCSQTFIGAGPLSEPEAAAIAALTDESTTTIHLDVHSYTQIFIAPYGYTRERHPRRDELDVPGMAMQAAVLATHGVEYRYGGSEILYPASGVARDYVASRGGFGWTVEQRPASASAGGFAPPVSEILPAAEEFLQALYAAINWVQNPPPPTPAPPPGTWQLTGSGCVMDGACVHSRNYPQNYGNNEACSIRLFGDIPLAVEGDFMTERNYDKLTVNGVEYHGTPPANLADFDGVHTGIISWNADGSVTKTGWKICRTDG